LRSWRVNRRRRGIDTILFSDASFFVKHAPLNLRQVMLGYLCTAAILIPVAALILVPFLHRA
jgi:hypothetical protein